MANQKFKNKNKTQVRAVKERPEPCKRIRWVMNREILHHTIDLCLDWKFREGEEQDAWYKGFDDSSWRTVNIPHDWAVEHEFSTAHSSGTGYLPAGTGFYRKTFYLPEECRGMRVYVVFDGVYNNSMVWCNSYYLGKRPNGYTQFIYDITDFVCFGDTPNVLTVKVDHRYAADSRWYTGSGIYRKVTLVLKNHILIPVNGVFVSTKNADYDAAVIEIQTTVKNATGERADISVRHTLYAGNYPVASSEKQVPVDAEGEICDQQEIKVYSPKLWSTENPFLYTLVTEIKKDGKVVDRVETRTGIRTFYFSPDNGFFLNGKNMKLKGVCVHHDAGCLGAAVRKKVWERRLKALKEMGCNAIRMSHNPHMPELYDLCDELGFLVIDEAFDEWEGVKNKWVKGHNVYPPAHYGYYEDFPVWHEADLTQMILRDRNHPSVILWSIGNEIDYPNDPYCHPMFKMVTGNNDQNKPVSERLYDPNKPNAEHLVKIAKKLVSIVKKFDKTRPVTAALAFPELSNLTGLADCLDVVGYNYKEHLYREDHRKYPEKIILGTENTKGLEEWKAVVENEFISGQFLWTGIDFLGETQGWPCHGSEAGLLDVAGFEKPLYYFRQSLWSDKPVIRLFTVSSAGKVENIHRDYKKLKPLWNYSDGEMVQVVCFTNCAEAELFLNGKSYGRKKLADYADGYITWLVPFEKGELKAAGFNDAGEEVRQYVLKTTGEPSFIRLECTDEFLNADGRDITHVIAEITDEEGNRVCTAEKEIYVTVEGEGRLLGLENGDLRDTTPYSERYRKTHNGKLLIYIEAGRTEGSVKVKAAAEGLQAAEIIIPVKNGF
ncbi:beta-galactosidase [Thermoclostridium stercorarium subsp. stercorarium DSM 8532]|nr:beta-galactosidase [Thermoclostridium stercorarium subsp. stercorarium DSM 8532]